MSLRDVVVGDAVTPLDALRRVAEARAVLDELETGLVVEAIDGSDGGAGDGRRGLATWAQIADALGRSVGAVHRAHGAATRSRRGR